MPSAPKFCDCPRCPCNVPLESARYGQRDCHECLAGNHMNPRGERLPLAPAAHRLFVATTHPLPAPVTAREEGRE